MLLLSIILEAAIVALALMAAQKPKKRFAYGLALTFGIYVVYDAARQFQLDIPGQLLSGLFLIATVSALWSMWQVYSSK